MTLNYPSNALPRRRQPRLSPRSRKGKRLLKFLTQKTISKSLINLCPQKYQLVTSTILSQPNPVTTEELLPYQTIWGSNASRGPPCKNYWSPNQGKTRLRRQPRLGFPPLHPPSPSNLNPPTSKGKGSRRIRRRWKEEKLTPPKRVRPKEGPNKLGWGKQGLTREVIPRSNLHPRPPPRCWMELANASIKDFQQGNVGYVAEAVEQALLLPEDMAHLKSLRRHEVFFSLKRDLAMVSLSISPFFFSFFFFFFQVSSPFFPLLFPSFHFYHVSFLDRPFEPRSEQRR